MKKLVIVALSIATTLSLISCNEDFLDTSPTETIPNAPNEYKLNGLYVMMVMDRTGGTTRHEDFGQKGNDIIMDLLSSDMALAKNSYNRYLRLANLSATEDFTDDFNYIPWRYYYRVIIGANDILTNIDGNSDTDKHIIGQTKALRAYAYFYLMQLYNKEYAPNEKAIPIYTNPAQESQPKSTQAQVYQLIIDDLTEAITLLDNFDRAHKGMIDKYVAKGLLAYVYAAMDNYAKVEELSMDIINNSGLNITTRENLLGGFNNLATNPSWMWGFDITTENGLDLISWWGQVDLYTYSYASVGDFKTMDEDLYNSIRTDDIRKEQFNGTYKNFKYFATGKFYNTAAKAARKIGGQRIVTDDYIFMRVDEFHLLAAEALAKQGKEAQAKQILKNFLNNGNDKYIKVTDVSYIDGLTGTALTDEIYLQTRIEFWGEGKSYLAMKRNKATITRARNHQFHGGASFAHNDGKLTLEIPQQEVNNNPNL